MAKFLKDILRDKGSTKYSITKTLALSTFIFLIIYLGYYLLWLQIAIDHTLLLELIGFTGALVGLKNNWGVRPKVDQPKNDKVIMEATTDSTSEDEGVF
jgi:hypothetical protein